MGFEVSPLSPLGSKPESPVTSMDQAMEWMKNNPDRAQELDRFLEQNPEIFNMLLDSLDK